MKQEQFELWAFADMRKQKDKLVDESPPERSQGPGESKAGTVALRKQSYRARMEGMESSFQILQILPLKKMFLRNPLQKDKKYSDQLRFIKSIKLVLLKT